MDANLAGGLTLDTVTFTVLTASSFVAGFIDAIAGGGGLLTLPALLAGGLSPVAALATSKLQSMAGTAAACLTYWRGGHIDPSQIRGAALAAFFGAMFGAIAVQMIGSRYLMAIMPALLLVLCGWFLLSPQMTDTDRQQRISLVTFAAPAGAVGFYDGFFGPGAGAFYAASLVSLRGFGLLRATAHTKALNLASNVAAMSMMVLGEHVVWRLGMAMAMANVVGNRLGSRTAMRWGSRLIRPLLVLTSAAMAIKLLAAQLKIL